MKTSRKQDQQGTKKMNPVTEFIKLLIDAEGRNYCPECGYSLATHETCQEVQVKYTPIEDEI